MTIVRKALDGETLDHAPASPEADALSGRWLAVFVLMAIYATQALDRNLISIVIEPIKADFHLSDSAVGFLAGTCYAAAYAIAGIPMGMLADRVNRRNLIAAAVVLWSGMTALSGIAGNAALLVAARLGLGAFEAPSLPASTSMISDLFPKAKRSGALGVFTMGFGLGGLLGYSCGGLIAGAWGWRAVFFVGGIPGLVLALLLLALVREPVRRSDDGRIARQADAPPLMTTLRFMAAQPSLLCLYAGYISVAATMSATLIWLPSFFIRSHGFSVQAVGLLVGVGYGLATALGGALGGLAADRLVKPARVGAQFNQILSLPRFSALVAAIMVLSGAGMALTHSATLAAALMMVCGASFMAQVGPNLSVNQSLVGPRMRGTATATLHTLVTVIATGFGAVLTGTLSDLFAPWAGSQALRYALCVVACLNGISVLFFLLMDRTLQRDLERAANY